MDVWFDSDLAGLLCVNKEELKYPADLYLEGSDSIEVGSSRRC